MDKDKGNKKKPLKLSSSGRLQIRKNLGPAGDKAKITMRFRGREIAHQVIGRDFLERIQKDLEEHGIVEQMPSFEGRQMIMVMAPKK